MLDETLVKVFCNISVPLLFRCSLLRFKYCDLKVLQWSINKKFLSKQSSVKHLFTSFAFAMKRSFRVTMFEMVTSCLTVFKLDATSTIDFAIRSGDRSDHLYRHEEQNDLGFLLKTASNDLSSNAP